MPVISQMQRINLCISQNLSVCLCAKTQGCEQLAHSHYVAITQPEVQSAISQLLVPCPIPYTTRHQQLPFTQKFNSRCLQQSKLQPTYRFHIYLQAHLCTFFKFLCGQMSQYNL